MEALFGDRRRYSTLGEDGRGGCFSTSVCIPGFTTSEASGEGSESVWEQSVGESVVRILLFSPLYLGGPNIFVYSRRDNFARHAFWSCTGRVLDYLFVSDDTLSKYRSSWFFCCCFFAEGRTVFIISNRKGYNPRQEPRRRCIVKGTFLSAKLPACNVRTLQRS